MRNRKWTALMLAGVMSLSLMACGKNAVNSSEEPSGEPVQEATGNETEDGGEETKEPSGERWNLPVWYSSQDGIRGFKIWWISLRNRKIYILNLK